MPKDKDVEEAKALLDEAIKLLFKATKLLKDKELKNKPYADIPHPILWKERDKYYEGGF